MFLLAFERGNGEAKDLRGGPFFFFEMMFLSLSQFQNVPSAEQVWFLIIIFRFCECYTVYYTVYPYSPLLHVICLFLNDKEYKTKNLRGDPLPTHRSPHHIHLRPLTSSTKDLPKIANHAKQIF